MRNHILLKFLAVALASLMLLTAVVSGLGLLVLTEEDLEGQTVEGRMEEEIRSCGAAYANLIAARYASIHLGDCPEELVDEMYTLRFYNQNFNYYGYTLMDSSGKILESVDPGEDYHGEPYRFSNDWQYIHVVSAVPESQDQPEECFTLTIENAENVIDNCSGETVDVAEFRYSHADGSSTSVSSDSLGVLSHSEGNMVIFETASPDLLAELLEMEAISYISFQDADGVILYEAAFPGNSGIVSSDGTGGATLRHQDGGVSGDYATVYRADFTDRYGDPLARLESEIGLGVFYYDQDGYAVFQAYGASIADGAPTGPVGGVTLYGENNQPIYSSFQTEDIGELFFDDMERLCFTSSAPARISSGNAVEVRPESKTPTEAENQSTETLPTIAETPDGPSDADAAILPTETQPIPVPAGTEITADPAAAPVPKDQSDEPGSDRGKASEEYRIYTDSYYDHELEENMLVEYVYVPLEGCTVELYIVPNASWLSAWSLLTFAYQNRVAMTVVFGVSLLLFALLAVYLCCAAGHTPGSTEIRPGGLNRLPLDLYAGLAALGIGYIVWLIAEGMDYLMGRGLTGLSILCYAGYACTLLLVGVCFAFAAQVKTPEMFLVKNSLCGRLLRLAVILLKCFWKACLWLLRRIRSFFRRIGESCTKVYGLLPMTWQWLLTACALLLILVIALFSRSGTLIFLGLLVSIAIVLYGTYSFGVLLQGVKRMRSGDLEQKVDIQGLVGSFREFAQELNGLSEVAVVAAREQMKSERMRSELITNVSHDIKTPLTSIINFVDLLQKPHTEEEEKAYLEVLSRQSDRLKKLIDDLMEMSKASTGNLSVDISQVDAAEAVNQALGEFGDKLASVNLTPVFHMPKDSVMMLADGRLAWRAMSNLLSNAVKYALPGTRLYIDLVKIDESVMISFKNISREQLNISADELMERFVRGDSSRNTEGSGLGLNIAKSLMELQKGKLQLLVDGDLFKATLIFPAV